MLPIILLILLGLVEVSFFISRYLDVMDLTREAARFASIRDPQIGKAWIPNKYDCENPTPFNFYLPYGLYIFTTGRFSHGPVRVPVLQWIESAGVS